MNQDLNIVKIGLILVLLGLLAGVLLGVSFGASEETFENYIAKGVSSHPDVHDAKSSKKIWRYVQRAHFHSTGIAAFSLGLILTILLSSMSDKFKTLSSTLVGLGSFYPLAWFTMFILAPSIGRDAAHHHILTETFTYAGTFGILAGILILCGNILFGMFKK